MSETDAATVARLLGLSQVPSQQELVDAMQARGWGWSWSPAPEAEVVFTRPVVLPPSVRESGNDLAAWFRCARRALEAEGPPPVLLTLRFEDAAARERFLRVVGHFELLSGVEVEAL